MYDLNPPQVFVHKRVYENEKATARLERMLKGLGKKGLTIHRVNDILPGADQYKAEYFLGGFDLHPNPAANGRIADYVVRNILKQ